MQFFDVNGCVHSIHLTTHPYFPREEVFFLLFYNLYEVINLKNETEEEEAIIVQPNPWLPMLNWASKIPMRSRGCSVTSQGELNSDNPLKRLHTKRWAHDCALAKTRAMTLKFLLFVFRSFISTS